MTRDTPWSPWVFAEDGSLPDDDPMTAFVNSVPNADSPAVTALTTCAMVGYPHSHVPPAVPLAPLPFLVQAFNHFTWLGGVLWVFWEMLHCFAFGWLSFPLPVLRMNHTVKELEDGAFLIAYLTWIVLMTLLGLMILVMPLNQPLANLSTLSFVRKPFSVKQVMKSWLVWCTKNSLATKTIMAGLMDIPMSTSPSNLVTYLQIPLVALLVFAEQVSTPTFCDSFMATCHPQEPSSKQTGTLPWLCSFQVHSLHLVSHHSTGQDDHLLPNVSPFKGPFNSIFIELNGRRWRAVAAEVQEGPMTYWSVCLL